jgi:hypothetical protein
MKATVRSMFSPDADLATFSPADPGDVSVLVQVIVGPQGGPGEESLDVFVCTPRWVARRVHEVGPVIGRHHLIVERWDYSAIRTFLRDVIESEEAPSWPELGERLSRIGKWEFEDYQPGVNIGES